MELNETLQFILTVSVSVMLIIFAFLSIESKKIINAVIYLSALSLMAVFAFIILRAPDVAITEAVIGSGLTTALFIFTLLSVKKLNKKTEKNNEEVGDHK